MLIWQRIKNTFEAVGYSRAASQLASQGYYEASKNLLLERSKLSNRRVEAIRRLERVKKAKANYEPGNHYLRGKSVAFWKGKAA